MGRERSHLHKAYKAKKKRIKKVIRSTIIGVSLIGIIAGYSLTQYNFEPSVQKIVSSYIENNVNYQNIINVLKNNDLQIDLKYSKNRNTDRVVIFFPEKHVSGSNSSEYTLVYPEENLVANQQEKTLDTLLQKVPIDAIGVEGAYGKIDSILKEKRDLILQRYVKIQEETYSVTEKSWKSLEKLTSNTNHPPTIEDIIKSRALLQIVERMASVMRVVPQLLVKSENLHYILAPGLRLIDQFDNRYVKFGLEDKDYYSQVLEEGWKQKDALVQIHYIKMVLNDLFSSPKHNITPIINGIAYFEKVIRNNCQPCAEGNIQSFETDVAKHIKEFSQSEYILRRNKVWVNKVNTLPKELKTILVIGGGFHKPGFFESQENYSHITLKEKYSL